MHHAEVVGGDMEVALVETQDGEFRIQTQAHEYPLDDGEEGDVHIEAENVFVINKAQIQPQDIKRLSNLEDAGIRGGIHSKRTYLMALHDGSLWVWKQTGVEERDEIFMYHLARRMFRAIVPEVQPVYVPKLGWGSAMRKVAGVPAGRADGLHGYFHGNEEMQADLVAMLVLDYLTGNSDRHANNWFLMHNDRLAAIDNGWAGEDLTMSLSDVFEPARLADLVRDESLWPKMLQMMLELVQDLSGRGDEARALAEEIKIDRKDAVTMLRLWEPKLERLARFIKSEASKLQKEKVYIKPGQQPPLGVRVEEGPRGGHYYESEGIPAGMEEQEQPVEFVAQPLTRESLSEAEMFNDGTFEGWLEDWRDTKGNVGLVQASEIMKNDVVTAISSRAGLDYDTVNRFVAAWSGSATQSVESLAMQNAAAGIFGLKKNTYIEEQGQWRKPTGEAVERSKIEATAIIAAMYEETQEWLKAQGVASLVLFRGMRWTEEETPGDMRVGGEGTDVFFHANPLSSWSSDPNIAQEFANYQAEGAEAEQDYEDADYLDCVKEAEEEGNMYPDEECDAPMVSPPLVRSFAVARVPAERVLALSVTGLGCLHEREVVVAGGKHSMRVYSERAEGEGDDIFIQNFVEETPESQEAARKATAWKTWADNNLTDLLTQRVDAVNQAREDAQGVVGPLDKRIKELKVQMQAAPTLEGYEEIEAKVRPLHEQRTALVNQVMDTAEEPFRVNAAQMIEAAGFEVPEGWKPRGL